MSDFKKRIANSTEVAVLWWTLCAVVFAVLRQPYLAALFGVAAGALAYILRRVDLAYVAVVRESCDKAMEGWRVALDRWGEANEQNTAEMWRTICLLTNLTNLTPITAKNAVEHMIRTYSARHMVN